MIGIEQLVIDDFGEHVLLLGQSARVRRVPCSDRTDGFSISTCLPASRAFGGLEVAIVGRGDADEIDAAVEQLPYGVAARGQL